MAKPSKPFSRAAAILSSGLETPSPEKKVCVCRSILNGIAGRLVCDARNGKCRFEARDAGCGIRDAGCGMREALIGFAHHEPRISIPTRSLRLGRRSRPDRLRCRD